MNKQYKRLERWTLPECYFGSTWEEYYVFLARNRDSDCLTNSNFECGLRDLGGESDTVHVVRENHWACGWIEWIAVHESDLEALSKADAMLEELEDYPVLDEDDWSEREYQEANEVWKSCYDPFERIQYIRDNRSQFEFYSFQDLLHCVRGEYFNGYASELIS